MGLLATGLALSALAFLVYVRVAASDQETWHVDPAAPQSTGKANHWHVGPERATPDSASPIYGVGALELARAVDEAIMSEPQVERLAGGPGEGWTTYVLRSRVFGFPDYTSVRVFDEAAGTSSLAIFARARFGRSDLGVNRARVEKWLAALAPMQQEPRVPSDVR